MIQIYADINDLVYSEVRGEAMDGLFESVLGSIIQDGIKHPLHCKPDGYILRGNTRLTIANIFQINYVPISLKALIGLFVSKDGKTIKIRKSIIDYYMNSDENEDLFHMGSHPVIPNSSETGERIVKPLEYQDAYNWYQMEIGEVTQ
ncbi:hypothetical protein KAR91_79940 [Candidatus Pacearchaeota archaeon]|nr:hypothetical protein [Candidatus Pacearchaeota archaeon]